MTIWNLKDCWPDKFSMPISKAVLEEDNYTLKIEEDSDGTRKLVIDIQTPEDKEISVLAMVPGSSAGKEDTMTLTFHPFWTICTVFPFLTFCRSFTADWIVNWTQAGRLPKKIHYENIKDGISGKRKAGEKIGIAGSCPDDIGKKQVIMKVEYTDSAEDKFMHPREFFSLLFWKKDCDPIFHENPPKEYDHPLLRKMMQSKEDGSKGNMKQLIHDDEWLGLRPPLRTFQRVKWEALREHLREDFSNHWLRDRDVDDRIKNKLIEKGGIYFTRSKCNIFAGEMLFRSGFTTIAGLFKYPTDLGIFTYEEDDFITILKQLDSGEIPDDIKPKINATKPTGKLTFYENDPWKIKDEKNYVFVIEKTQNAPKLKLSLETYSGCQKAKKCGVTNKMRYIQPGNMNPRGSECCIKVAHDHPCCIDTKKLDEEDCECFDYDKRTHRIKLSYGKEERSIDRDVINWNIENKGYVYLAVSNDHVVIVDKIESANNTANNPVCAIDQWIVPPPNVTILKCENGQEEQNGPGPWKKWTQTDYAHRWDNAKCFMRILPRGDPTEVWGILSLNRLQEV